ncbi:hypothetical protein DFH29DRAFT_881346 [Suillus ampliporus]|nr:hypothetical protein DFH29DRAFT_881346 [Suillus ampliporus]
MKYVERILERPSLKQTNDGIVSFIRQSFPAVRNLRYNQVGTFGHYSSIATILPGAGWYKKYKAEAYPIFFAIPRACSKRVAEPTLRRREALRRVALVFDPAVPRYPLVLNRVRLRRM